MKISLLPVPWYIKGADPYLYLYTRETERERGLVHSEFSVGVSESKPLTLIPALLQPGPGLTRLLPVTPCSDPALVCYPLLTWLLPVVTLCSDPAPLCCPSPPRQNALPWGWSPIRSSRTRSWPPPSPSTATQHRGPGSTCR